MADANPATQCSDQAEESYLSPAERLLHSAFRVTTYKGDKPIQNGTAFFYAFEDDGLGQAVALITNRHVLDDAERLLVSIPLSNEQGRPTGDSSTIGLNINEENLVEHPSADLCGLGCASIFEHLQQEGLNYAVSFLTDDLIPSDAEWSNFDAFEDLIMIGCPNGIYDQHNSLPIARRGSSASHVGRRYEGRDEFLVDMACFPGSSGSPVFRFTTNPIFNRSSRSYEIGRNSLYLLGILYAGPQFSAKGYVVLSKPDFAVPSMMHLGNVIRSSALKEMRPAFRALGEKRRESQR